MKWYRSVCWEGERGGGREGGREREGGGERGNADILQVDVHNILNNYLSMEGSMKARQIQLHPCIQYTCTS